MNRIDVTELSYFITFDGNVVDSMTIADLTMTEIKQVLNITIKSTTKMYSEYIFSTANRTLTRFDELFFVTLKTKVFQADITAIQNMMKAAWVKRDKSTFLQLYHSCVSQTIHQHFNNINTHHPAVI